MSTTHTFGWKKQKEDPRDFKLHLSTPVAMPRKYDLTEHFKWPAPYDQGQLGSCTANCIAGALEFDQIRQGLPHWTPSRLFIYYNERVMEGSVGQDAGAEIRDGIKSVNLEGACREVPTWPYDINRFADAPPPAAVQEAANFKSLKYMTVNQDLTSIKAAILAGYAICFGITCFPGLESEQTAVTGMVPMPKPGEQPIGGHAILLMGYDSYYQGFKFRNSWGTGWGKGGYGFLHYKYVLNPNLATDFWAIETVT